MKVSYYPGCTLKTHGKGLESSALACLEKLGITVEELPRWNCCGAVYSLADDDLIHMVAPVRDLVRAKEQGNEILLTLCAMCYNTLARANALMKNDPEKRKTINWFMDEELDYSGEIKVVHFLDFLRDYVGWDKLREKVTNPLKGLKAAPYYGCTLLRPKEAGIDRFDNPSIFQDCLRALGAEAVDFDMSTQCCGTYQVLGNPEASLKVSFDILKNASEFGAEALVLACPLCDYNLGKRQGEMKNKLGLANDMPVYYFTQLMALALGVPEAECHFELNREISLGFLKERNFLKASA